jgi:hypothetical protein
MNGQMVATTMGSGQTIWSTDMENIIGQMEEAFSVNNDYRPI